MQSTLRPNRRRYVGSESGPAWTTVFTADPHDRRKRLTITGGSAVILAILCSFGALSAVAVYAQKSGPISHTVAVGSVAGEVSIGPDVVIGSLHSEASFGSEGGVSAFSFGFRVCNFGDEPVEYVSFTHAHPVITQNLYRLNDGRFEQIGMSWAVHEFAALSNDYCDAGCVDPDALQLLGVACSTYSPGFIAGQQSSLAPRSLINAHTGAFPYPYSLPEGTCANVNKPSVSVVV